MEDLAKAAIDHALKLGAEYVDIRLEKVAGTNIVVMDGRTKHMVSPQEAGCGIRAFKGGAWGFSVTNRLSRQEVRSAAGLAVRMAGVAQSKAKIVFEMVPQKAVRKNEAYPCKEPPVDVPVDEKVQFALSMDGSMRSADQRIVSTNTRYDDLQSVRVVANSFGTMLVTKEAWALAACSAWARSDGIVQRGYDAVGAVAGYELMRRDESQLIGHRAAAQALRLLDSSSAPAGMFTCILDNRMTGLLAHEAFGHACEADLVLSGSSVLEGKLGERVASEDVSMYDDPTVKGSFGYFSYDWEGTRARPHVLIDRGVLKEFLHSIESSSRMGVPANGAARAETYSDRPIIRMSNTYIGPGDWSKDEMIGELDHGLLIQGGQYGYVEPAKGQFMFKCEEAYEIVKGEIGHRYRDVSISGVILEVLRNVKAVADDVEIGDPGYCGKGNQSARTAGGGPHICVSKLVVGGLA